MVGTLFPLWANLVSVISKSEITWGYMTISISTLSLSKHTFMIKHRYSLLSLSFNLANVYFPINAHKLVITTNIYEQKAHRQTCWLLIALIISVISLYVRSKTLALVHYKYNWNAIVYSLDCVIRYTTSDFCGLSKLSNCFWKVLLCTSLFPG